MIEPRTADKITRKADGTTVSEPLYVVADSRYFSALYSMRNRPAKRRLGKGC